MKKHIPLPLTTTRQKCFALGKNFAWKYMQKFETFWLLDDDIEYIEKLRQNKKFKFCHVFMNQKIETFCFFTFLQRYFKSIHFG